MLLFSMLAASSLLYILDYHYTKDGPLRVAKIINIEQGDSLIEISDNLAQNGIIESKLLFLALVKIKGLSKKIKYGEYLVEESVSISSLLESFSKGVPFQRQVTIPEGLTSNEIAQILGIDSRTTASAPLFRRQIGGPTIRKAYIKMSECQTKAGNQECLNV